MADIDKQLSLIKRGSTEVISEEELVNKLKEAQINRRPLHVKAGFDPSAPDIHLGHTVLLRKLKHFQELGHSVYFLIGDFTGRIGDPSGQTEMRKQLSKEEVIKNAKTYKRQIFKILDPKRTRIVFNSRWYEKMTFDQAIEFLSKYTVARMLERDDFLRRFKENRPISILEFIYPLIQGYDSVVLKADVELGGTDQKFNLLVGRELQREFGHSPQIVITMPLLEGTDGINKMSKSLNNYIGINEPPKDMFGKIMSVSDDLMWRYSELLTDLDLGVMKKMHPKEAKLKLATEITKEYHGESEAKLARQEFERVFKNKELPQEIVQQKINIPGDKIPLINLLDYGLNILYTSNSKNELRRLIQQGAVKVNSQTISNINYELEAGREYLIQVGRRSFVKVILKKN
ncbi:MAG: tyrosine--tRNA ligase [Candidatus Omnitrophica bacterium]|nr:tyrosine--tRNA ligase [Candidatus Omnitrophota bacterium]MDD5352719.1 tyrosine--tRNA ligase [Candidatus Omnitrophota bacterium]MDD5550318.1 tyrosine--tRNA ligase [Candidatus Omnitrophota bacterium]